MKLEYKIPKGWRRVVKGCVQPGDMYPSPINEEWEQSVRAGLPATGELYIRRIKKGGRK